MDKRVRGWGTLHSLDWVALALLTAGALCVATGLLPAAAAEATVRRILPLLLFLVSVVVLAELTALAEVFDVVATRLARAARGSYAVLFVLCVAFASVTTITLNLDTTAILLTPVMLALARKLQVAALPFAMTTVWLANTASLLLPVSNLTNLLAANRVGLRPIEFAARMWLPQIVAIAVTMVFLWLWYWRRKVRGADAIGAISPHRPQDLALYRVAAGACVLFIVAVLAGVPLAVASGISAGITVVAFALRDRSKLTFALLPWRLVVFVSGLFLVVQTVGRYGLNEFTALLVGGDDGVAGAFRAGAAGAGLSNVVNNLPTYVAGEAVIPVPNRVQLLALLIGTNVGPLATPWASLATLLWYERCRAQGLAVPMRKFLLTGAALGAVCTVASVGALLLVS